MRLAELSDEDKIILRAMIDLTCNPKVIHTALQKGPYDMRLKKLTFGQISILINDAIDFDADFDDELDLDLDLD